MADRIAVVGVIAALDSELQKILDLLEDVQEEQRAGIYYYVGKLDSLTVVATVCGVGKVNAAICTQLLCGRYGVQALLNTGIAGSLHKDLVPLSLVIPDSFAYHDVDAKQMTFSFPYVAAFDADLGLTKMLRGIAEAEGLMAGGGLLVTGDAFIAETSKKREIQSIFDAACVDMESAAIAHTAYVNGIPFAAIRCISDIADDMADDTFREYEEAAAEKAAGIMCLLLRKIAASADA